MEDAMKKQAIKTGFQNIFLKLTNPRGSALGAIVVLVFVVSARADTVNFDNYISPTDNDLRNHFNSADTQTTSGGITGGAVQAPGGASIYRTSFDPLAGLTTSVFFRYEHLSPNPPGGPSGGVGFTGSAASFVWGDGQSLFWAEFASDDRLIILNKDVFPIIRANLIGTTAPPGFGNWLRISFSELYLGNNLFELSASVENYGATGMEPPTLLVAGSVTVTNSLAAADPSVFAAFSGYYNVSAFDNFSVVPEPATIHIIAFGALLLGCMIIKERRR